MPTPREQRRKAKLERLTRELDTILEEFRFKQGDRVTACRDVTHPVENFELDIPHNAIGTVTTVNDDEVVITLDTPIAELEPYGNQVQYYTDDYDDVRARDTDIILKWNKVK